MACVTYLHVVELFLHKICCHMLPATRGLFTKEGPIWEYLCCISHKTNIYCTFIYTRMSWRNTFLGNGTCHAYTQHVYFSSVELALFPNLLWWRMTITIKLLVYIDVHESFFPHIFVKVKKIATHTLLDR